LKDTWLLIDSNNLASRLFYALPNNIYGGRPVAVIQGFLRTVMELKQRFNSVGVMFAFDNDESIRKEQYPFYQSTRGEYAGQTSYKDKKQLTKQLIELQTRTLPSIGFKNVFSVSGYEADDIIAKVAMEQITYHGVIVSSDKDLFQCLSNGRPVIEQYDIGKKKLLTVDWFRAAYKIDPSQWAEVKAMAGCTSDNIKGIPAIGEKRAITYLNGGLGKQTAAMENIKKHRDILLRNRKIVTLPLTGLSVPNLQEDKDTTSSWYEVMKEIGLKQYARGIL